jgi:acyl-coenzyme A thioesterase PaaI-like protein
MRAPPPDGFEAFAEPSPFLERIGPLFQKTGPEGPVFGLRVEAHHCNRRGLAHGGLLATLADIALGKSASWSRDPPAPLLTTSLTTELIGGARPGDWIEARCDFRRVGRSVAFANCYMRVGDRVIARASAIFSVGDAKA